MASEPELRRNAGTSLPTGVLGLQIEGPDAETSGPTVAESVCVALAGYGESKVSRAWFVLQIVCFLMLATASMILVHSHIAGDDSADAHRAIFFNKARALSFAFYDVLAILLLLCGRQAHHRVVTLVERPVPLWRTAVALLALAGMITAAQVVYFMALLGQGKLGYHEVSAFELVLNTSVVTTAPGIVCALLPLFRAQHAALEHMDELGVVLTHPTSELDWELEVPKVYGKAHSSVRALSKSVSKVVTVSLLAFLACALSNSLSLWVAELGDVRNALHMSFTMAYIMGFVAYSRILTRVSARFAVVEEELSFRLSERSAHPQGHSLLLASTYMIHNPICWEVYLTNTTVISIKGTLGLLASLLLVANALLKVVSKR